MNPTIGWFGADVIDWVGEGIADTGDVFIDVFEEIPLAPEVAGVFRDLVEGPLRDFARTDFGMTVLRAISTGMYGFTAMYVGPQMAAIAFAFPGIVRGEDFWTAWAKELQWRGEKTAEYLAPGAVEAMGPAIKDAVAKLVKIIPYEDLRGMAADEIAKRINVDEWTAAAAAALLDLIPMPKADEYDLLTGKPLPGTAAYARSLGGRAQGTLRKRKRAAAPTTPECIRYQDAIARGDAAAAMALAPACNASTSSGPVNPCESAKRAEAMGQSAAIVRALRAKCYAAQDAGEIDEYGYWIPESMRAGGADDDDVSTVRATNPDEDAPGLNLTHVAIGGAALLGLLFVATR